MTGVQRLVQRHPLLTYFAIAYAVSAGAPAVLGLPRLDAGGTQNPTSLAGFPVLIISVAAAGVTLTAVTGGRADLADLVSRMRRLRIRPAFYLVLLVPPLGVLVTLLVLTALISPAFRPGFQVFGLPIELVAGLFEEIG